MCTSSTDPFGDDRGSPGWRKGHIRGDVPADVVIGNRSAADEDERLLLRRSSSSLRTVSLCLAWTLPAALVLFPHHPRASVPLMSRATRPSVPKPPVPPVPMSLQSLASIFVVLDCPDRLASVCRDRTAERSQSAVISPCWNVRNPVCGVGVGHTGPKGFGHRRGNTWTHTTVCFNGFCIPNLKLGLFFSTGNYVKAIRHQTVVDHTGRFH